MSDNRLAGNSELAEATGKTKQDINQRMAADSAPPRTRVSAGTASVWWYADAMDYLIHAKRGPWRAPPQVWALADVTAMVNPPRTRTKVSARLDWPDAPPYERLHLGKVWRAPIEPVVAFASERRPVGHGSRTVMTAPVPAAAAAAEAGETPKQPSWERFTDDKGVHYVRSLAAGGYLLAQKMPPPGKRWQWSRHAADGTVLHEDTSVSLPMARWAADAHAAQRGLLAVAV